MNESLIESAIFLTETFASKETPFREFELLAYEQLCNFITLHFKLASKAIDNELGDSTEGVEE